MIHGSGLQLLAFKSENFWHDVSPWHLSPAALRTRDEDSVGHLWVGTVLVVGLKAPREDRQLRQSNQCGRSSFDRPPLDYIGHHRLEPDP